MTDSQPAPGTGWQVVSTMNRTQPDAAGVLTAGTEVHFTTGTGQPGQVFIPGRTTSVDQVRAAVQAEATRLDTIMGLKG